MPVLFWRAIRGKSKPQNEVLNLVIAALEALRNDLRQTRSLALERDKLLTASIAAIGGRVSKLDDERRVSLTALEERLEQRVHFARTETMFELRSRLGIRVPSVPGQDLHDPESPKVIAEDKLAAMRKEGQVRLNLGCGHVPLDGYLNTDVRELPGVDVVADVAALPFEVDSVSEIHSAHLLEHFPIEYLSRVLLRYWYSLLKPGGRFEAIVPDAEAMLEDYRAKNMTFDDLREATFGLQEYEGDFHFNMFARDALKQLLQITGFEQVEYKFTARKNGKCRDMMICGVRG
jgi:hypothetical protein